MKKKRDEGSEKKMQKVGEGGFSGVGCMEKEGLL